MWLYSRLAPWSFAFNPSKIGASFSSLTLTHQQIKCQILYLIWVGMRMTFFFCSSYHFSGPSVSNEVGLSYDSLGIFFGFLYTIYFSYPVVRTAFPRVLPFYEYWLPLGKNYQELGKILKEITRNKLSC